MRRPPSKTSKSTPEGGLKPADSSSLPLSHKALKLAGDPDRLFEDGPYPTPFEFNQEVVQVFDDMVSRSVPMYLEVNRSIAEWSFFYYQKSSVLYDIGCSTGTTIACLAKFLRPGVKFVGIDSSQAMIDRANLKLEDARSSHDIDFIHADALNLNIKNASVVVMTYTLQFIPVVKRAVLLKKIFDGLLPGGILYLSEKVRGACPDFHETQLRIYENFKLNAGYSKSEIEKKKEALDNVLIPLSLDEQMDLLKSTGFSACEPIMKWNNFVSIVAKK